MQDPMLFLIYGMFCKVEQVTLGILDRLLANWPMVDYKLYVLQEFNLWSFLVYGW